jgi:hypothetical protein
MANQSKSMIFGFVIIAAIIFAVALGYRMTQDDNPAKPKVSEPVVQQDKEPEIKVVSYDKEKTDDIRIPTPEEKTEIEARSPFFMEFAMRFQNGTDAVNALPGMIERDEFEKAEYLIKYIESTFPDTKIPDEFAEL